MVVLPALSINGNAFDQISNTCSLAISDPAKVSVVIEATQDLRNWIAIVTNPPANHYDMVVPTLSSGKTFYRARMAY